MILLTFKAILRLRRLLREIYLGRLIIGLPDPSWVWCEWSRHAQPPTANGRLPSPRFSRSSSQDLTRAWHARRRCRLDPRIRPSDR